MYNRERKRGGDRERESCILCCFSRRQPAWTRRRRPPIALPGLPCRTICRAKDVVTPSLRRGTPYPTTYIAVGHGGMGRSIVRYVSAHLVACPPT